MQHANIWTPSARVFSSAVWVSLNTSRQCYWEMSAWGKTWFTVLQGFCSLSRSSNLLLYAAITNRSRISDPENCHVSLRASAVWYAVLCSLFLTSEWRFCSPIWMGAVAGVKSEVMFFFQSTWCEPTTEIYFLFYLFIRHKSSFRKFCHDDVTSEHSKHPVF